MVLAWFMDDSDADQRLDHHRDPPALIDLHRLEDLTGVLYWDIDVDDVENDPLLAKIRADRGYSYKDEITCSPEKLENYEEKLKSFFQEHLHTDEEIRLVLGGSGFFDIRDMADNWIRIKVEKGDLIVLPAGSYHRFTLDTNNYIKALRLFVGEPVWTPINRPADDHPCRKEYLLRMGVAAH